MLKRALILSGAIAAIIGLSYLPAASASKPHEATSVQVRTVAKALNVPRPGSRLTVPATYRRHRVRHVQWLRCNARGSGCKAIRHATGRVYIVRAADIGHTLRALITWQGQATATTAPTQPIGRPLPVNTALPTITDGGQGGGTLGGPVVGDVLTGSTGTWQHAVRFTYQWMGCDAAGANCAPISGATSQTYTLQDSDVGDTIVFQVTAYNF